MTSHQDNTDCDDADDSSTRGPRHPRVTASPETQPSMTWYQDADLDGFSDPPVSVEAPDPPAGCVVRVDDCADTDDSIHRGTFDPSGSGTDQDCNGVDG